MQVGGTIPGAQEPYCVVEVEVCRSDDDCGRLGFDVQVGGTNPGAQEPDCVVEAEVDGARDGANCRSDDDCGRVGFDVQVGGTNPGAQEPYCVVEVGVLVGGVRVRAGVLVKLLCDVDVRVVNVAAARVGGSVDIGIIGCVVEVVLLCAEGNDIVVGISGNGVGISGNGDGIIVPALLKLVGAIHTVGLVGGRRCTGDGAVTDIESNRDGDDGVGILLPGDDDGNGSVEACSEVAMVLILVRSTADDIGTGFVATVGASRTRLKSSV